MEKKRISVSLPIDQYNKLLEESARTDRSMGYLGRKAIKKLLEE